MKNVLFVVPFALAAMMGSVRAMAARIPNARIPTASGDYCCDEVNEYLAARFGLEPSQIKLKRLGASHFWSIHAWTPLCQSDFVFVGYQVATHECTNAQYGSRTFFIKSVHAMGDCLALMPHDEYLH